jgi:hypothetical protein
VNERAGTHHGSRPPRWSRAGWVILAVMLLPLGFYGYSWATFPSDRTPEGAYLRIVKAVNRGKPEEFFAYTEEAAQHACYTIANYRKQLIEVIRKDYPADDARRLEESYARFAAAPDGADVFAIMAHDQGWLAQLRLDVSAIAQVDQEGPRATIQTVRGTRYSMRRRPGGIWGLTAFTPVLVDEAEKAARDLAQVKKAAEDFARAHN